MEPKWIAIESSSDGYDVLSRMSASDNRRMTIEVKASEQDTEFASFHLTRNEWETAIGSVAHRFHLWALARAREELAVLTVEQVGRTYLRMQALVRGRHSGFPSLLSRNSSMIFLAMRINSLGKLPCIATEEPFT